jgi:hypothetical protein
VSVVSSFERLAYEVKMRHGQNMRTTHTKVKH